MKSLVLVTLMLMLGACDNDKGTTTGNPVASEDESASGAVAQAVGGVLSSSSSNGSTTLSKVAHALTSACPTFASTTPECTTNATTMWLDYNSCSFGNSGAEWNGTQALIMSNGTPTCGTFPNPGNSHSLIRQFVQSPGSTSPWIAYITSRFATVGAIDDVTSNLSNFDNQTLATLANGGYGQKTDFGASGQRTGITIARRVGVLNKYDHTIYGSLTIGETAGAATRTVSGSVDVYLNGALKVVGTSVFSGVVHSDMCCVPISGSITTSFAPGANVSPTGLGQLLVGKSETLTFTGCGTATHTRYDGTTRSVALSRCY